MAQPLSHGTEDLEPSPSTKALPGTRFLCFHYFIPFTTALQSSFALAFLPQRLLSAGSGPFSLTTSSWEGSQSPYIYKAPEAKLCPQDERWHLVHTSLEPLSVLQSIILHKSLLPILSSNSVLRGPYLSFPSHWKHFSEVISAIIKENTFLMEQDHRSGAEVL